MIIAVILVSDYCMRDTEHYSNVNIN